MSKEWILGAMAIGLSMMPMACSNDSDKNEGNSSAPKELKFVSFNYSVTGEITGADSLDVAGSRYIRYTGEGIIPDVLGDDNIRILRDSIEKIADIRFGDDNVPSPVMDEGVVECDSIVAVDDACGENSVSISASLVSPRVVTFNIFKESYECMAAHGMNMMSALNYDIEDGKVLRLADIVTDRSRPALLKLLRSAVSDMSLPLLVDIDDIEIPEYSFEITAGGLEFLFQPYEIAPFSEGIVHVMVDLGKLIDASILTPRGYYLFTGSHPEKTKTR